MDLYTIAEEVKNYPDMVRAKPAVYNKEIMRRLCPNRIDFTKDHAEQSGVLRRTLMIKNFPSQIPPRALYMVASMRNTSFTMRLTPLQKDSARKLINEQLRNKAVMAGKHQATEQIDAMEIMGVNSANFLILPKMLGLMIFIPVLVIFSMFTGIMGGIFASYSTSTGMTPSSFEYGLQFYFNEFYIWYSIIKSVVYAFIISSIAAYFGYNVKGGALEVGKASTNAVVMSSIMILLADVILTHLMLT